MQAARLSVRWTTLFPFLRSKIRNTGKCPNFPERVFHKSFKIAKYLKVVVLLALFVLFPRFFCKAVRWALKRLTYWICLRIPFEDSSEFLHFWGPSSFLFFAFKFDKSQSICKAFPYGQLNNLSRISCNGSGLIPLLYKVMPIKKSFLPALVCFRGRKARGIFTPSILRILTQKYVYVVLSFYNRRYDEMFRDN